MSTSNFYSVCGKYFVVEVSEEEEELQSLEDVENAVLEELEKSFEVVEEDKWDGERNYAGRIFGSIRKYFKVFDKELRDYVDLEVYINLILRSGYFMGCNLDYSIEIYLDGQDVSDLSYSDYLNKTNAKKLNSFVRKATKAVERVYKKYTEQYYCLGIFSNGEAIYEKA